MGSYMTKPELKAAIDELVVGQTYSFTMEGDPHALRMFWNRCGISLGKVFRTVTHGDTLFVLRVE